MADCWSANAKGGRADTSTSGASDDFWWARKRDTYTREYEREREREREKIRSVYRILQLLAFAFGLGYTGSDRSTSLH